MNVEADKEKVPKSVSSIFAPGILLFAAAWFVYWAYDYGETARQLPVLIGTGTMVLIVLDILSRLSGRLGSLVRSGLGAGFQDREMKRVPQCRAEFVQLAWVAVCVVSICIIGILATVPVFVLAYMYFQGRQGLAFSILIAVCALLLVGLVFEVVLDYELYRGILFDGDG